MKNIFVWMMAAILVICGATVLTACGNSDNSVQEVKGGADLVVYGKIFTSEGNQVAEAFAVKNGKYIYVGDKKGAEAYVESGRTMRSAPPMPGEGAGGVLLQKEERPDGSE